MPGASRSTARASPAVTGCSNSTFTASPWPMNTGTRTQVAMTAIVGVEDLPGLDRHLPLFLGRAVVHELVDMRDAVEGDFLGELLRRALLVHEGGLGVVEQLVHPLLARAGDGLVGGDHHAPDLERVVQRLQRHHHLDGASSSGWR